MVTTVVRNAVLVGITVLSRCKWFHVHGYKGTRVHGYTDTRIYVYTDIRVHGYTGTWAHWYTAYGYMGTRGHRDTGTRGNVDKETGVEKYTSKQYNVNIVKWYGHTRVLGCKRATRWVNRYTSTRRTGGRSGRIFGRRW